MDLWPWLNGFWDGFGYSKKIDWKNEILAQFQLENLQKPELSGINFHPMYFFWLFSMEKISNLSSLWKSKDYNLIAMISSYLNNTADYKKRSWFKSCGSADNINIFIERFYSVEGNKSIKGGKQLAITLRFFYCMNCWNVRIFINFVSYGD